METTNLVLHFDGSCTRNPGGRMGFGWHLDDENGDRIAEQSGTVDGYPTHERSCNTAELTAMLAGLEWLNAALFLKVGKLKVIGDSQLAINLADGSWNAKKKHIAQLTKLVQREVRRLEQRNGARVVFQWKPREENSRADTLSTAELYA